MFKDVEFMTAKEKELVLKSWKNFLTKLLEYKEEVYDDYGSNLPTLYRSFTERLYTHIMQNCEFIAHYDRHGFYQNYFADPEDSFNFFQQFDKDKGNNSFEYGGRMWLTYEPYMDINQAMCDEFEKVKRTLYKKFKAMVKKDKLLEIKRLQSEVESIGPTEQQQTLGVN